MKIEVESAMLKADNDNGYVPVFRGQELEIEGCMPEVSLRNLQVLLNAGLKVSFVSVIKSGHVFIAFSTGETYLATGFSVGCKGPASQAMAKFLSQAFGHETKDWYNLICDPHGIYPENYVGPFDPSLLAMTLRPGKLKPKVFTGE